MDSYFERVKSIIDRLRNVLRCQKCLELKKEDFMLFYPICDHFYCSDCIENKTSCPFCENPLNKPKKVVGDKNILSLYQSLINFELPSKNDVEALYESCKQSKEVVAKAQQNKDFKNQCKINLERASKVDEVKKKANVDNEVSAKNLEKSNEPEGTSVKGRKNKEQRSRRISIENVTPSTSSTKSERSSNNRGKSNLASASSKRGKQIELDPNATPVNKGRSKNLPDSAKSASSALKININKRNPKGETQLHLASKKSNFSVMKELIEAGADPNAKDNAGWTALHDSVFSGNIEVIKFLLENGANVNTPGLENTTALHEAIAKGNVKVVELLLEYGADIHAMNIFRETPLDLVTKYNLTELKEILLKTLNEPKQISKSLEKDDPPEKIVIYKHFLSPEDEKLVNKFSEKFNLKMISSITVKSPPTHIVVSGSKFEITWGLVSSVLSGCWIVTVDWVKDSLEADGPKPASPHELSIEKYGGFAKARINKRNQLPDLFCGCHFYFGGNFDCYNVKNLTIGKEDLKLLVEKNGGKILKRSPNPESLALEKTVPYHAKVTGSLRETAYYIIYQSDKWNPHPRYAMSHLKTLPVDWLIYCIFKFELIDPKEYDEDWMV